MKIDTGFKIPCWFGHSWPIDYQHRPCMKFRVCKNCLKEETMAGWHKFSNWSDPYEIQIFDSYGRTVGQDRQKHTCSDCNMVEERILN